MKGGKKKKIEMQRIEMERSKRKKKEKKGEGGGGWISHYGAKCMAMGDGSQGAQHSFRSLLDKRLTYTRHSHPVGFRVVRMTRIESDHGL